MVNHPGRQRPPCFTLKLDCGNAAFDGADCGTELATILRRVAEDARHMNQRDYANTIIHDSNGNRVGEWRYRGARS